MRLVSGQEMRDLDNYCVKQLEIPEILLVENAAISSLPYLDLDQRHSFAIFCGTGNNGADGLAIARHLLGRDKKVHVFLVGHNEKPSQAWLINFRALRHMTSQISSIETIGDLEDMDENLSSYNTIIDAIFGTGLNRPLSGVAPIVIDRMNESRIFKISIDLPSGIDADSGRSYGAFVEADRIICMEFMKAGLKNLNYSDAPIHIVSAGIPIKAKRHIFDDL